MTKKNVNFLIDPNLKEKFDASWKKLGYRNATEVLHEKIRAIIKEAEEANE